MIDRITRHAAQSIWHHTLQDDASCCGILLSEQGCIVAGVACLPEAQHLAAIVEQHTALSSKKWCGWFYTTLPAIETMMAHQRRWAELHDDPSAQGCMHLHLDSDAKGLLKMAAYRLHDGDLSTVNLTMAMH